MCRDIEIPVSCACVASHAHNHILPQVNSSVGKYCIFYRFKEANL